MKNGNVNVVTCPPCGESTAKSGVRGAYKATSLISPSIGPTDHFLRKGGRKGFTLIELLVVVLIIGILAAVAVPQYQRAVEKSKATQALSVLKSLAQATRSYYLANGKYPTKFEQLDVDMTAWTGNTQIHTGDVILDTKSHEDWSLQLWSDDPGNKIMIMCLRTTGKYKAGGFVIGGNNSSPNCVEDSVDNTFPLSKKGMYCEKLFNGTVIDPTNSFRRYSLP